jgi:DNA repair protein RecN (Recombination protein N)
VKNLALIDESEVEFKDGLNILTGETGAGKSIVIGSVNLALGEKVPKELLRDNDHSSLVELVFVVEDEATLEAIRDLEIEVEDETVILSRKIKSGRAVARINGEAVSAAKMKEVASLLIDIHGQHEHQSLLSRKKHLEILDTFAKDKLGDRKERLAACYHEYRRLKDEWAHSNTDEGARAQELSFLEYEMKEIEEADLKVGEDEKLEERFRRIQNGKKIMDAVHTAREVTIGEGQNASELIGRALREISGVSAYDKRVAELEKQLTDIDSLMSDFGHEISAYLADEEFDDEDFYEIQKRLDFINHLKLKYGNSIEAILKSYQEKADRVVILRDYDKYLNDLSTSLEEKKEELDQLCEEVSAIRKEESLVLCAAIREALEDLNFLNEEFTMEFLPAADYSASGTDDAQFLISTNPGEPLKPLNKVASGGELSRIALAIKTVMAENDSIATLIFDEIDSGISGRTAQMVSEKMNLLGKNHQIICITHLPQIAAMADTHFEIKKSVEGQTTVTRIHKLDSREQIDELSRLLSGAEITDKVRASAQEMKRLAEEWKKR